MYDGNTGEIELVRVSVRTESESSSYQELTVHIFAVKISVFYRFVLTVSTH